VWAAVEAHLIVVCVGGDFGFFQKIMMNKTMSIAPSIAQIKQIAKQAALPMMLCACATSWTGRGMEMSGCRGPFDCCVCVGRFHLILILRCVGKFNTALPLGRI
jgi:hypothetical protein